MRTFEGGNWDGAVCPLCGTAKEGKIVLVPIAGTFEGNLAQAREIHVECIGDVLIYYPEQKMIAGKAKENLTT